MVTLAVGQHYYVRDNVQVEAFLGLRVVRETDKESIAGASGMQFRYWLRAEALFWRAWRAEDCWQVLSEWGGGVPDASCAGKEGYGPTAFEELLIAINYSLPRFWVEINIRLEQNLQYVTVYYLEVRQ
jgi:hypothetical protein